MNNDNHKDYQTVLEEQTPLVCKNAVENKSTSTRLATLLSIGIAVFAFLAMAGQHVSHFNNISQLKAALADHQSTIDGQQSTIDGHQSQLQALTVQSTPLLGTALQGSSAAGDMCVADNECSSGFCINKPYAFCVDDPDFPDGHACQSDAACASKFCHNGNCKHLGGPYDHCSEDIECRSGNCDMRWIPHAGPAHQCL